MALPAAVLSLTLLAACGGGDNDSASTPAGGGNLSGSVAVASTSATAAASGTAAANPGETFAIAPAGSDVCAMVPAETVKAAFPTDTKLEAAAKTDNGGCHWAVSDGSAAGLTVTVQKGDQVEIAFESARATSTDIPSFTPTGGSATLPALRSSANGTTTVLVRKEDTLLTVQLIDPADPFAPEAARQVAEDVAAKL
jgi:hypothetical protein